MKPLILSPLEHFAPNYFTYFSHPYDFSLSSGSIFILSLLLFLVWACVLLKNSTPFTPGVNLVTTLFSNLFSIFFLQVHSIRAVRFANLLFAFFIFLFFLNFGSLFLYGFPLTGHILVSLFFSFSFFLTFFLMGGLSYGRELYTFFIPSGVPPLILPLIILIEIFSFAIRPFSLAIRLFANMLAGHTLLGIFSQFFIFVKHKFIYLLFLPLLLIFLVFLLELAVSLIQAYIFVSLLCIYLSDMLSLHN